MLCKCLRQRAKDAEGAEAEDTNEDEDEEDGIPWSWKYVSLVLINPLVGGLILNFVWGALSLHWVANGWPAWHLGALSMIVVQLRTPAVQLLVSAGLWMTLIFVLVSFLVMLPSIFLPEEEWAAAVLVVCEAFETYVLYDSVSFVSFAETEKMAQQASAHTLQAFTLSMALAPTVGGSIYLLFGWKGIAWLGAGAKLVQLIVLVSDETVQRQLVCIILYLTRGRIDDEDDDFGLVDDDDEPINDVPPSRDLAAKALPVEHERDMHPVLPGAPMEEEDEEVVATPKSRRDMHPVLPGVPIEENVDEPAEKTIVENVGSPSRKSRQSRRISMKSVNSQAQRGLLYDFLVIFGTILGLYGLFFPFFYVFLGCGNVPGSAEVYEPSLLKVQNLMDVGSYRQNRANQADQADRTHLFHLG